MCVCVCVCVCVYTSPPRVTFHRYQIAETVRVRNIPLKEMLPGDHFGEEFVVGSNNGNGTLKAYDRRQYTVTAIEDR